jgi:hypothetical protein
MRLFPVRKLKKRKLPWTKIYREEEPALLNI